MATIYRDGSTAMTPNPSRGLADTLAAESGSDEGMRETRRLHCAAFLPASRIECYFWLRRAADAGRSDALVDLARALVWFDGDHAAAAVYLRIAADDGSDAAAAMLNTAQGK